MRNEFLTLSQCVHEIPEISYYSLRKLIMQGKLPAKRVGDKPHGKILFRKSDLLACFEIGG